MEGDNLGAEDNILQVLSQQHPFPQVGRSFRDEMFVIESAEAVEVGELCDKRWSHNKHRASIWSGNMIIRSISISKPQAPIRQPELDLR